MDTKDYNHLPEWLPKQIAGLGLTPEQFAQKCGFCRATVYFYLNGEIRPSTQAMAKMCHLLGVPLEEALKLYTPKHRGHPFGVGGQTTGVTVRHR